MVSIVNEDVTWDKCAKGSFETKIMNFKTLFYSFLFYLCRGSERLKPPEFKDASEMRPHGSQIGLLPMCWYRAWLWVLKSAFSVVDEES